MWLQNVFSIPFHSALNSRLTISHSRLANVDRSHIFPLDESNVRLPARKVDQRNAYESCVH